MRCSVPIKLALLILDHLPPHVIHELVRSRPLLREATIRWLLQSTLTRRLYCLLQPLRWVQSILRLRSWSAAILFHLLLCGLSCCFWFGRHAVLVCRWTQRWHSADKFLTSLYSVRLRHYLVCLRIRWMFFLDASPRVFSPHLRLHFSQLIMLITPLLKLPELLHLLLSQRLSLFVRKIKNELVS